MHFLIAYLILIAALFSVDFAIHESKANAQLQKSFKK